ncbi:MAG: sigma-54-dependent transcriptional regulator [Ignavibacteriaceae bacterium]
MFINSVIQVLLIEDEEYDVIRVMNTVKPFRDKINISNIVSDGNAALDLIKKNRSAFDVVVMDFHLAGGFMGEELIQKIKEIDSSIQIIVITKMTINITDFDFANKLMRAGAFWYCTKYPGDIEDFIYQPTDFLLSIFNAYEKSRLEKERLRSNQKLIKNIEDLLLQKLIIGESPMMKKLKEEIKKYAQSDVNILISGSSGTGKELVAYNIHYNSERKLENFVPINCGSLPHDLIESELFGYEKGAFTGADKKKAGLFEIAHNGTVFLDEITELPLSAQVKLLRVIQEGELEKIGRTEKIKVNIRIIAATNKNIEEEVKARRFREDLYYRLNVIYVEVPDLKIRKSDIPILLEHFILQYSNKMGKEKPAILPDALEIFTNYPWPGNVRELKNVVQRLLFSDEHEVKAEQAKLSLGAFYNSSSGGLLSGIESIFENNIMPLSQMEKTIREKYLVYVRHHSDSDTDAARKLGLAPSNYYRMAKELGLK